MATALQGGHARENFSWEPNSMQPAAGTRPLAPAAPLCPYSRAVRRPRRTGVGAPAEDPVAFKHILIAVPTMAGLMKARTTTTLVLLMRQLTRAGVAAEYLNVNSSDIVYARNFFAREMLRHEELDGLLFVDSDMQFRPALVRKMINLGADIMATAYPKRALDMDRYSRAWPRRAPSRPRSRRARWPTPTISPWCRRGPRPCRRRCRSSPASPRWRPRAWAAP